MSIFERISNILRANINDLLDRAEDPEKMLNQIIRDMEAAIEEAKLQVAAMVAQEKLLRADLDKSEKLAGEWAKKAELAVRQDEEGLALEALRRKNDYREHADIYEKQWIAQRETVEKLKRELRALESKHAAAVRHKSVLIARRKQAAAQRQVADTGAELSTHDYTGELARMERRIVQEEAEAAASAELAQGMLTARFDDLAHDAALQEELAVLQAKVLVEGGNEPAESV